MMGNLEAKRKLRPDGVLRHQTPACQLPHVLLLEENKPHSV